LVFLVQKSSLGGRIPQDMDSKVFSKALGFDTWSINMIKKRNMARQTEQSALQLFQHVLFTFISVILFLFSVSSQDMDESYLDCGTVNYSPFE
jgi:hypothetical protein